MTLRTSSVVAVATSTLVLALVAPAAYARWIFHDAAIGEAMVAPPGGTRATTCTDRLRATAGWGSFVDVGSDDPDTFPVQPDAFDRVSYRVWKAPAGFDSFASAFQDFETGRVIFVESDGTERPATLVGSVRTPARKLLATPRPAGGERGVSDNYVFTTAPIKVDLGGVQPGDLLGLAPKAQAGGIFGVVKAIDCDVPVLDARVDLHPGTSNQVSPHDETDLLPVRVFGSKRLPVRHITAVRLGEAAPVEVRAPRDVDRDGRADRVYVFEQGDTGIQCLDSTVAVTGRTSDRVRFERRTPVIPTGCAG